MLMQEPAEEMIKEWKDIYNKNKDDLKPNKKESLEVIEYLKENYSVIEIENLKLEKVVYDNIVLNEYSNQKLCGKNPIIRLFEVTDKKLVAFAGLDNKDITNYFLVAQYIKCKEKFNK